MHYLLIIVDGIPWIYDDMARMIKYILHLDNKISEILFFKTPEEYNEATLPGATQHVYFGQMVSKIKIKQSNSIITEFDPYGFDMISRLSDDTITNNKFSCYSKYVIERLKEKYPNIIISKFDYGYSSFLDYANLPENNKLIDVCILIGQDKFDRRTNILNKLLAQNIDIFYNNILVCDMDRVVIYSRSKIIISVYSKDENLKYSSGSRIFPAVSMGCFVISEKCTDEEEHKILEQICINVPYDELIPTIIYYVNHPEERIKLTKKFYENIKSMKPSIGYVI